MPSIDNGEPGCATAEEVNQPYRNNWDPTSYWQCGVQGEAARSRRCSGNKLFSDEQKKCVPWTEWHWTEPKEPPSRPQASGTVQALST